MKIDRSNFEVAMARKAMNQVDLAKKCGISQAMVSKAATGADISTRTVGILAHALGCDVETIIQQNSDPGKEE